jgi:S1-C subfamily serine protease
MDGTITPPENPLITNPGKPVSVNNKFSIKNPNFVALAIVALILALAGLLIVSGSNQTTSNTQEKVTVSTNQNNGTIELASGIEIVSGVNIIKSIVQVVVQDNGEDCAFGSGSVIIGSSYVLTNFHVVENDESCKIDKIFIDTIDRIDLAPVRTFSAEIFAINKEADLAILKITPLTNTNIELVPVKIAPEVRLGDEVTAIGFPAIGGDSVTVTKGEVSGFNNYGGVRWIKSSISISGGNSGGGAFNAFGELIGVPTSLGVPGNNETTDCRPVRDTNGDGKIDSHDECVSMGGFINSLSPGSGAIDLAKSKGLTP